MSALCLRGSDIDVDSGVSANCFDHSGGDGWHSSGESSLLTQGRRSVSPPSDHLGGGTVVVSSYLDPQLALLVVLTLSGISSTVRILLVALLPYLRWAQFPFLSLPSLSSSSSTLPVASPSPPSCSGQLSASGSSRPQSSLLSALFGEELFSLSPKTELSSSSPPGLFRSLGSWISRRGGRVEFCRWLSSLCDALLEAEWCSLPVDVAWERILEAGGTEFTDQVEQVLYEDADRIETDLHALMAQAQVLSPAVHITDHVRGSKRCFAVPSSGSMGNRDVNVGIREKGWPGGGLVLFGGAKNENLHAIVRVKPLGNGKRDFCLWGLGTLVDWGLQKGKILSVALLTDLRFEGDGCRNISVGGAWWC